MARGRCRVQPWVFWVCRVGVVLPAGVFSNQMVLKNGVQERALARRPGSIGSYSSSGHVAGC